VLTVAERLENALGEERWSFIDSCPAEWAGLPMPNGPITVGIDGGYVKAQGEQGRFEVIAGKSLLAFTRGEESQEPVSSKCFAFVQTFDQKPKRRLFEVLKSQGHQLNRQITFLSDGGDTVRELQLYLNPQAEHVLDWFHVTMRLTMLQQTAKGLPPYGERAGIAKAKRRFHALRHAIAVRLLDAGADVAFVQDR
jgi:integrase